MSDKDLESKLDEKVSNTMFMWIMGFIIAGLIGLFGITQTLSAAQSQSQVTQQSLKDGLNELLEANHLQTIK